MEKRERELIETILQNNTELKRLYLEHENLEKKLISFERRNFLTPREEMEMKKLKKIKLWGVDRMMRILSTAPVEHVS